MNRLEWILGLRYALVGRGDRFVSFASLTSVIGMAIGVAALIVVMSVMNGFHLTLRDKILAYTAQVEIHDLANRPSPPWPVLGDTALEDERVQAIAPNVRRPSMLLANGQAHGALVLGVAPDLESEVSTVATASELEALRPQSFNALIGKHLANRLRVEANDEVVLIAPSGFQTLGGFIPRFKKIKIYDIIDAGVHDLNNSALIMNIEDAAVIYQVEDADSVRLKLVDAMQAPQVANDLGQTLNLPVHDWTTANATFFNALAVERRVMFVILTLIIAVAAFQIVATLVTMVRSKRGAIAVLQTVGMKPMAVMRVFLIQGMLVGFTGVILGLILGVSIATNIHDIVTSVEGFLGIDFFPGEVYLLEQIPSRIVPANIMLTSVVALVLTFFASIFPALAASKVDPAEVLRHE